jgi:aconitate hydratase
MGVLPLQFPIDTDRKTLGLKGDELVSIEGVSAIKPQMRLTARISYADGRVVEVPLLCRIDTLDEVEYFRNGGILPYVLRNLLKAA